MALDDPVPSDSTVAVIEPQFLGDTPHRIESAVRRVLLAHPDLHFKVLVVRRVQNGVYLEGVLDADEGAPDVSDLASQIPGVECVINRLLVRRSWSAPRRCR
ncbi:MAG: BON domain-containing protein [Planctomycetaceae bacterium]